jgi:hypothetical protein
VVLLIVACDTATDGTRDPTIEEGVATTTSAH